MIADCRPLRPRHQSIRGTLRQARYPRRNPSTTLALDVAQQAGHKSLQHVKALTPAEMFPKGPRDAQVRVPGAIDGAHAALPKQAGDAVAGAKNLTYGNDILTSNPTARQDLQSVSVKVYLGFIKV